MKKVTLFSIFIAIFFTACATKNISNLKKVDKNFGKSDVVSKALYKEFVKYKGVKYKYGGTTKAGLDCSAFIQNSFKSALNVKLPRTTKYQSKVGKSIKKSNLKVGDLVFFKTGYKTRHVGIYINNSRFIHVSTKKGVTISNLNNPYFKKHYWMSRRVLKD